MNNLLVLLFLLFATGIQAQSHSIIPEPNYLQWREGHFILPDTFRLFIEPGTLEYPEFLESLLKETGKTVLVTNTPTKGNIIFKNDSTIQGNEAYHLEVNQLQIEVRSSDPRGAFYATQSLMQQLRFDAQLSCVLIKDEPRFSYRGMHLDVGRHFFSPTFIKKYIDLLATYKFNTFHWHLTEDQGWRIEIEAYPRLQEIAAYREQTLIGHYNDQPQKFDGKRYGGYYTREEIKDIVQYAAAKHITIIPEIEMPGHARAALAAYPELSCTGGPHKVATKWGVFEEVYCTKEETFLFLENVLDEVMELFPSKYIHIGGDECPKRRWKNCTECQQRIQEQGLANEHELQSYFIRRIEKYLNGKGRQIIGWDEILEGGLAPNATVMSWRGTKGGIEAARSGHHVVMTPTSHCYFDYYQSDSPDEPLAIGGYLPLAKVYDFNPVPAALSAEEEKYILGAQGNVWTEYMPNPSKVEYMVLPRMQAMAEVGWTDLGNKDFSRFIKKLDAHFKWWESHGLNYADKTLEIKTFYHILKESIGITLETLHPESQIFFTRGDREKLLLYQHGDTIRIDEDIRITARAQKPGSKHGARKVINIQYHKGMGRAVSITHAPAPVYEGYGIASLFNGINGSDEKYGDNEWLGFSGHNLEVTIQFEEPITLTRLKTRFFHGPGQWIHAPGKVEILAKQNDGEFSLLASGRVQGRDMKVIPFELNFPATRVSELKIIVHRYGKIPEGMAGAGHEAWLFVDELRLN